MQKKQLELLIAVGLLFILTSGTSFLLCEKDIVLEYINRVGNWSNAILLKSTYVFVAYTLANSAYNIDYVLPKVAHSLFVIKYFDKVNGWLGFSSKGELEAYLEVAKQSYSPLYKDFLLVVNNSMGIPLYNNLWSPFLTICGFKKPVVRTEVVTQYIDRPVDRVTHVPVIDSQQLSELRAVAADCQQVSTDLKFNLTLELSNIRRDWHDFLGRSSLTHQMGENLSFLTQFLNENYVRLNTFSYARVKFSEINRTELDHITDNLILDAVVAKFNLFTSQILENKSKSPVPALAAYFSDIHEAEGSLIICNISDIFTNDREFLGVRIPHNQLTSTEGLRLLEFLKNSTNTEANFLKYNPEQNNLIIKGFFAVSNLDPEGLFEDTSAHISVLNSQLAQASVAFTSLAGLATGLVDSSHSLLHAIDLINNFNASLQNTEIGATVASVFMHYGQPLPEVLQHYASQSHILPNPQDYLLSGESLSDPSTPNSIISNGDNPESYFNWKTVGIGLLTCCAIGGGIYLYKNGCLDYNTAVESAKTFKETLQDKYTNFK